MQAIRPTNKIRHEFSTKEKCISDGITDCSSFVVGFVHLLLFSNKTVNFESSFVMLHIIWTKLHESPLSFKQVLSLLSN